jgi:hypothetical protein
MLSLCVGGRRREDEEEEEPGIQNQKQEPHTKMWGKRDVESSVVFPINNLYFIIVRYTLL